MFIRAQYPPDIIPELLSDIEEMVELSKQQDKVKWADVLCCPTKLIRATMIVGFVFVLCLFVVCLLPCFPINRYFPFLQSWYQFLPTGNRL